MSKVNRIKYTGFVSTCLIWLAIFPCQAQEQDIDRAFSVALISTSAKIDDLDNMSPRGIKLSWARFFFDHWAMEFQLFSDLLGVGADFTQSQFQGVSLSRKMRLEPSGQVRLRYQADWGQRLHPYMALGMCYCMVKATRVLPTDDPDFYDVSYEVIDRGGFSAALGANLDISSRYSLFLEWGQDVRSHQLKLGSFSLGLFSSF